MKIHVVTLGCPKNIVDSEYLIGGLSQKEIEFINDPLKADVIIINTCSFIISAREEAIETILEAIQLKNAGKCQRLYVTGCLPQKYRVELERELPEVDGFYDQLDFKEVAHKIAADLNYLANETTNRHLLTPKHYSYLKIAEGCNNRCSYCTIPSIKGDYLSRDFSIITEEAEALVEKGVRELIIIAQDTTYYGRDLNNGISLNKLIKRLSAINNLKWIRLLYAHPAHLTDELIYLIRDEEKICKYIDIPMQHISDPILEKMQRKVTGDHIKLLIEKLRKSIPDISCRTTLMVGFPGETEDDFQKLVQFVKDVQFERLGVFKYSQENDTAAALLPGQVSEEQKEERLQEIMQLQSTISFNKNDALVNNIVEVVVDEYETETDYFIARTQWDSPQIDNRVLITKNVNIGSFFKVKIEEAAEFDLIGSVVMI